MHQRMASRGYAVDGGVKERHPEYLAANSMEAVTEAFKAHVQAINKTMAPAKNIRRLRLRTEDFDKTTSRKIKRTQTTKGEICG